MTTILLAVVAALLLVWTAAAVFVSLAVLRLLRRAGDGVGAAADIVSFVADLTRSRE